MIKLDYKGIIRNTWPCKKLKSRKRKQWLRACIRYALCNCDAKHIRDIWDAYWYEVAKQCWEELNKRKYNFKLRKEQTKQKTL